MPLANTWSREAALRLAGLGHEVHAIDFECEIEGNYLKGRDDIHVPAIRKFRQAIAGIHTIPGKSISQLRYVFYAPRLAAIFRRTNADILLTLWGSGFATIAYFSGIRPYAVFVGGGDILRVSGIQKAVSRHAMSRASIVFANGKYFSDRAREFAPEARVVPLYYGVDPSRFMPGRPSASPIVIVCTRGFLKCYNNSYIIEALTHVPAGTPDFRLIFTSAGGLMEETKRFADSVLSADMRRKVSFLNGVSDEALVANLQQAHIYTTASTYDGTSISLLEAFACGLFPVISDIPANREWIADDGSNGTLVPLNDPAAYGRALANAIRDASWRERAAKINRQVILERADSHKTMADLAGILEQAQA